MKHSRASLGLCSGRSGGAPGTHGRSTAAEDLKTITMSTAVARDGPPMQLKSALANAARNIRKTRPKGGATVAQRFSRATLQHCSPAPSIEAAGVRGNNAWHSTDILSPNLLMRERAGKRGDRTNSPSLPREWSSCHWCQTSFSSSSAAPSRPRSCQDLDLAQWRSGGGSICKGIDAFSHLIFQAPHATKKVLER